MKAKRNKAYKPRPALPFGGLNVIADKVCAAEDLLPICEDDLLDLGLHYHIALEQMLTGQSSEDAFTTIVVSLNTALVLAERGFGKEYEPYIVKALDGAFRAKVRGDRTNVWRFDGEAISSIREALEVHDEQVKVATKRDLRNALMEVNRRVETDQVYKIAA